MMIDPTTPPPTPPEPPPSESPPVRTPQERVNDILAEGYMIMPTVIGPTLGTHTPVVEFLRELLLSGWQISFQVVERPKQQ